MIWPEKLDILKRSPDGNYRDGWNAAIDACKEANKQDEDETPNDLAFQQGYNAGYKDKKDLEDFKKKAQTVRLVPLDEEYIASQLASCLRLGAYLSHNSAIKKEGLELRYVNHAKMEAKSICARYGTTSPKVLSLLDINDIIKRSDLLSLARTHIESNRPKYRYGTSDDMSLELAQAIHKAQGGINVSNK